MPRIKQDRSRHNFYIDNNVVESLKAVSATTGQPMSEVVRRALVEYLGKFPAPVPEPKADNPAQLDLFDDLMEKTKDFSFATIDANTTEPQRTE